MNTYGTKSAGLVEALVEYNGKRKPGIRELTEKTIIFNDGTQEEVDEIICCTAFINQFPFLEIADKQADPNHSKLVRQIAEDARISHDLYKHCVHPDIGDELFFIGFVRPCFGAIPPLSEMQARWYALLCSQKLQLPDKETMIQESKIYVKYLEWQLTPYRTNRIVNLTDFLIYSDDLARTIGCRPNLLKMFFTEPYLSLKCICGPIMSVHYRLTGPNSQPVQARRIIKRVKWIKHSNFFCLGLSLSHGIFWFCGIQACKPAAWYRISI
ncbi:unnamed protein product [Didymodactylos carnosus]|nr:unnamed protein product [Didymodactylos carnosus]CAF4413050.1 unnamed protein product [Didymodactylos carnosus]